MPGPADQQMPVTGAALTGRSGEPADPPPERPPAVPKPPAGPAAGRPAGAADGTGPAGEPGVAAAAPDGADAPRAGGGSGEPNFALDGRTFRRILYLLLNLPYGLVGFVGVVVMLSVGLGLAVTVVGIPLLAAGLTVCRAFGTAERARARSLLGHRVPPPSKPFRRGTGFVGWAWSAVCDPVGWRAALYFVLKLPWAVVTFTIILVKLVVGWPLLPVVARALAAVDKAMISALLAPSDRVERRIRELEASRGMVVDTAAADLRRIERDLHDGAQARLVALAMGLGLAKEKLADDPETAARMVEEAHSEAKLALQELRDLARGIHPAILTDRGLAGALPSLGARCTVPVRVEVELAERPAPAIEGIVYFTASELLANISKHSGAREASVELRRAGDELVLRVVDDGRGGAAVIPGGGLAGLAERLSAIDGTLRVESPPAGPTTVVATVPWRDRPGDAQG